MSAVWRGSVASLVEQPNSPAWDYGDKITATRTFRGQWSTCLSSAAGKGTAGTGDYSGYIVANCKLTKEKPGAGLLVVTYERAAGTSNDPLPANEESLKPFEANPRLESHPYFADLDAIDLDGVDLALNGSDEKVRKRMADFMGTLDPELPVVKLFTLKKQGVENYYLAGVKYILVTYHWTDPGLNKGGYVESPTAGTLSLPTGLTWLRLADEVDLQNGRYKRTRSWLGAPSGHWISYLYS